jgi:NAD(P)-dependent dehydrogenase (short-subunit alcohol dehydrogenase family)
VISDEQWALTLEVNVTANHILLDETAKVFGDQDLDTAVVLTSSANAVVSKRGSEAYDVSKAALSHLVREYAVALSPKVRVNGISPATVVKGSNMFPRDRVIASLKKYDLPFEESSSDEDLRTSWPSSMQSGHSPTSRLILRIVRGQSCSWRVRNLNVPQGI